jgi:hypothetical protein
MRKTKGCIWPRPPIISYIEAGREDVARQEYQKGIEKQFMKVPILLDEPTIRTRRTPMPGDILWTPGNPMRWWQRMLGQ